jgi:oligoribonuclease NrnB/cAMP/cGMP phosphodiesterase (DHH superfamily)
MRPHRQATIVPQSEQLNYNKVAMSKHAAGKIQIVSHGPSCFDGVVSAVTVARFYQGFNITPVFAANQDADRIIQELRVVGPGDEIWITDLSWNHTETADHLRRLSETGARVFWIDHHRSALRRLGSSEFDVPFAGKLLSEDFSASRLAYNFLSGRNDLADIGNRRAALESFFPIIDMADDHDRWVHRLAESPDWALAVQTLGSIESYRELLQLSEPKMTRALTQALESGKRAMRQSMELADSTAVERSLGEGLRLVTACCFGYSSEVAAHIYQDRTNTIVALLDMRSGGVSLRRSADCTADLSKIASALGGGGHAAASGFVIEKVKPALAAELSEVLGESILRTLSPATH